MKILTNTNYTIAGDNLHTEFVTSVEGIPFDETIYNNFDAFKEAANKAGYTNKNEIEFTYSLLHTIVGTNQKQVGVLLEAVAIFRNYHFDQKSSSPDSNLH